MKPVMKIVDDSVLDLVWNPVRDQLGDGIYSLVRIEIWDRVGDQIWDQIRDQVKPQIEEEINHGKQLSIS